MRGGTVQHTRRPEMYTKLRKVGSPFDFLLIVYFVLLQVFLPADGVKKVEKALKYELQWREVKIWKMHPNGIIVKSGISILKY